jgi:hypothetical protein
VAIVVIVVGIVLILAGGAVLRLIPAYRGADPALRLLSLSGIPLGITGVNFILRFWHPSAGPLHCATMRCCNVASIISTMDNPTKRPP